MHKILFATSEAHPLIKSGGLGDVSGSLPRALQTLGQDVRLILPAYREAAERAGAAKVVARLELPGAPGIVTIREGRLCDGGPPVWLVDSPPHFNRPGSAYGSPDGQDWPDNAERFALFARAVVELAGDRAGLGWRPDVVHCNDWPTGLIPALLSLEPQRPATVFTIHNLAYQGLFSWDSFMRLGLPFEFWSMHGLEFHGRLSFIKGGLVYADWLTTVSPTYAEEICTPAYGCGLDGLLRHRHDRLTGILNGADYEEWDPAHDPLIAASFDGERWDAKAANKAALQRAFGLPVDPKPPLIGLVNRLVAQKGIDLVLQALEPILERGAQVVLVGSGEWVFEDGLRRAAARHRGRLGVHLGYDERAAHMIEAGADMFLMPSRFEPCGLNQIYSLRYGTVPIVRSTGGLADTVVDASTRALEEGTATGFVFEQPTREALLHAVDRALALYRTQPVIWREVAIRGMAQDFGWEQSAAHYLDLYRQLTGGR